MDENQTETNFDRLTKRREHLVMTLRHLDREYQQVEQNTDWLDQAARENRVALLDRLNDWYLTEVKQIDRALERIKREVRHLINPSIQRGWKSYQKPNTAAPAKSSERASSRAEPSRELRREPRAGGNSGGRKY